MITLESTATSRFPKADCNECAYQENIRQGLTRCTIKNIDCASHDPESPCTYFMDVRE